MQKEKNVCLKKGQVSRKTKIIKILYSCSRMELPKISMEGKWLEELGFQVGDRLRVEYGNQYLCISHATDVEQGLAVSEPGTVYMAETADRKNPGQEELKTKQIRVVASTRVRHKNTCSGPGLYYPERSKISMEGKWLEKAGFHIGNRIQVDYWENCICIYPVV